MASRVSSPVLIGRAHESGRLRALLGLAGEGRSGAVVLAGEAGVGKTRLVADFVELARESGAVVLLGGCIVLGDGALPYAPVVEALRGLVRRIPVDELDAVLGQGRSELARLVPDLGPVAEEGGSALNMASAQGRLFELLLGVLERLAARAPVVFVVEDLHWSDRSTRDLVGFLVRNLRDAAVMLLLTYRTDELHRRHPLLPFLAELERTGRVERLELQPFDRRESADQLRAIAGGEVDAALAESIHARSGGNAFFAEELLAAAGAVGELPRTLRDVLLARVADLAEPTQELLRIASAAGQRVDPALLAAAADMDEAALYEALRECVGRQVLVPDPTAGAERYAFRHALLQEAVYDDLLPGERTRLHSAFARTLEARTAGDASHVAELAYHWYAAHDLPRALEASVVAARAAEANYAFPEALAQYERAIDLWDQVPDAEARAGRDRIDLLAALAGVARFHEPARAVASIQAAIRLADQAGDADPLRGGLLNERLGRYAWIAGQGDLAKRAYATAMRRIPAEPPSEARARAVAGLAQILMLGARFEEARDLAQDALALARSVGAREIEGHAQDTRGLCRAVAGEIDPALDDMRAALAIAEEVGNVDDIGRAYANWIWILDLAGRLDEAIGVARVGIATAERLGSMRFFGSHMLCNAGDELYRLGRWEECEQIARRAEEANPLGVNEILAEELLARLALARGHLEEATVRLRPLAPLAELAADIQFVCPVRASLAELALWQGRPDVAAAQVAATLAAIDFSPETRIGELYALGLRANADVAEIARVRRSPELEHQAAMAGQGLLEGIRRRHAEVVASRPAFEVLSVAWLRLCEAEARRLRRVPDVAAWSAAVEAWEAIDRPYAAAYAHWREAEARLAARGDRALAAAGLRAALDTADRLAAAPLAREIAALAARARLDLEPGGPGQADAASGSVAPDEAAGLGLTAREREVLALVALGRTNRQIADELFITANTAGVHVSRILGKLGVAGRGEAAAVAYRLGLVETGAETTLDAGGAADPTRSPGGFPTPGRP